MPESKTPAVIEPKERTKMSIGRRSAGILGISAERFAILMQDGYFRDGFEQYWVEGALIYLSDARHLMSFSSSTLNIESLCSWGLSEEVARAVIDADPTADHLDIEYAIVDVLLTLNGTTRSQWSREGSEWPSKDRPLGVEFFEYPNTMFSGRAPVSGEAPIKFRFTQSNRKHDFFANIPPAPEGRFYVYHACSWESAYSISRGVRTNMPSFGPERHSCDFGTAFYVTKMWAYSHWWALRMCNMRISGKPAIVVFSLPLEYRELVEVIELTGDQWHAALCHFRKGHELVMPGIFLADILEGPVCKDVSSVNACEKEPEPLDNMQLAFKSELAARLLELERIIVFKRDTRPSVE